MVVLGGKGQHFELEDGLPELKRTQICPPGSRKYTLKNTRKTQFFTLEAAVVVGPSLRAKKGTEPSQPTRWPKHAYSENESQLNAFTHVLRITLRTHAKTIHRTNVQ